MSTEIATAIEQRRLLSFSYDGHERKVIPAALGVAKRKGKPVLHAYQVEGGSSRGGVPAWRFFYTDKMTGLRLLDETFAADPPGWRPSLLENVTASLSGGQPSGGGSGQGGSGQGGGMPSMPSIPPEAEKIVKDVMGAVGKWFKKR